MTAAESPDIRQLQGESLPAGDFPVGGKQDYRVFFAPAVHEKIWKHASENVALEICGVLVGNWQRDAVGPFVTITDFIRCDSAKSGFAEVTFTHESWTKINAEMDTRLSAFKIVGWYHSHPDFGIFLSDRDIFIHQHFFSGAGQIAHVVDPVRKIEGVFAWQAGGPVLRPHFWVGERVFVTPDRPPPEKWDAVRDRLAGTERHLGQVRQTYSLTPEEQAVVKDVVQELVNLVERESKSQRKAAGADEKSGQSAKKITGDDKRKGDDKPERGKKKSAPPAIKSDDGPPKSGDKTSPAKE